MQQSLRKLLIASLPFSLFGQVEQLPIPTSIPEMESELNSASLPLAPAVDEIAALGEPLQISSISSPLVEPGDTAPLLVKKTKSPSVAVLLSGLVPGLGHYYLGEPRVASELLGSTLLGGASAYATRNDPSLFATSLYTMQAVGLYSVFAAYQDAHLYNGNPPPSMPRDNLKNLTAAPFQWSVVKKPEVWGACLGALALGVTTVYFAYPEEAYARVKTTYIEPLNALPIAIGEESLFRGYLQTALTEKLPPWGAITISSIAFGAAHIPNALRMESSQRWRYYAFSLPFITSLGAYMGWLTHKNRSLKVKCRASRVV